MKFNMSEAWREATAMLSANREVLLIIAGIFFFLPALVSGFVMPGMDAIFADPENMQARMMGFYADYWWVFLLTMLAQLVGYLALLSLLRDHGRPTVGEAISLGLKALLPALGVVVVLIVAGVAFGIAIGLLAGLMAAALGATVGGLLGLVLAVGFLILGIFLVVRLSLWTPVMAIDKVFNPLRALSSSWRMTRGHTLRLFVFYLLLFLVYLVVSIVVGLIVGALVFAVGAGAGLILSAVLSGLISAIATVIFVAVLAAVHRQLSGPSAAAIGETFD